jgi:hypothetical protein
MEVSNQLPVLVTDALGGFQTVDPATGSQCRWLTGPLDASPWGDTSKVAQLEALCFHASLKGNRIPDNRRSGPAATDGLVGTTSWLRRLLRSARN